MSLLQLLILSIVQGITEWLPISSSGHVLLVAGIFGLVGEDEILINAMAHLGTLLAVLAYFRTDVWRAILGGLELIGIGRAGETLSGNGRLAVLILASLPAALIIGVLFTQLPDAIQHSMRSVWVVIAATVIFALALWWADARPDASKMEADMSVKDAALIGATQAVAALVPGTSRSGITMTAARALGFSRIEAARFSMLIGAPLIVASGGYAFLELFTAEPGAISLTMRDGLIVAGLSAISGYASIAILMKLLERISFLPFVIYRLLLGAVLLAASPLWLNIISA
ncbi:MAG: undecaprenyl-diphosphate phosphatase [Hyphomonadaceae bacterium]